MSDQIKEAIDWIDNFIADANVDDRGACDSVNIVRAALSQQGEPVARACLIERYAQAAHWYINAHAKELQERGDTREAAIQRVHAIDGKLLASGYEWLAASPDATPQQGEPEQPMQPASPKDIKVYQGIADNYHSSRAPQPVQQPLTEEQEREAFENFITKPPFEVRVHRLGKASSWPGHYAEYMVQLAWEAWKARAAHGITQKGTT